MSTEFHAELRLYEEWVEPFTLCTILIIAADDVDFVPNQDALISIANPILDRPARQEEAVASHTTT